MFWMRVVMNSFLNIPDTLLLVIWSACCFLFISFLGYKYPIKKYWKYSDLINILLGMSGLILFFSENQNIRDALPVMREAEQVEKDEAQFNKKIASSRLPQKELHYHYFIFQRNIKKFEKMLCSTNVYSKRCKTIQVIQKEFERLIPYQHTLKSVKKIPLHRICEYVSFAKENYDDIHVYLRTQKGNILPKDKLNAFSIQCNSHNGKTPYSNKQNELAQKMNSIQNEPIEINIFMLWVRHDLWAFFLSLSFAMMMGKWMCEWKNEE